MLPSSMSCAVRVSAIATCIYDELVECAESDVIVLFLSAAVATLDLVVSVMHTSGSKICNESETTVGYVL